MSNATSVSFDEDTLDTIQERVLKAEKKQLHMKKPHNIIPEIEGIIKEEVPPAPSDEEE